MVAVRIMLSGSFVVQTAIVYDSGVLRQNPASGWLEKRKERGFLIKWIDY